MDTPRIRGYRIQSNAALVSLHQSNEPFIGVYPISISITRDGKYVYVASMQARNNDHAGTVYAFKVAKGNTLTPIDQYLAGSVPTLSAVDELQQSMVCVAYESQISVDVLYDYKIDIHGRLLVRSPLRFPVAMRSVSAFVLPTGGNTIYAANGNTLMAFKLTGGRSLRPTQTTKLPYKVTGMYSSPNGRLLYLICQDDRRIYVCRADARNGRASTPILAARTVDKPEFATGTHDGKALFVVCDKSEIVTYHVDHHGALSKIAQTAPLDPILSHCTVTTDDRYLCLCSSGGYLPGSITILPLGRGHIPQSSHAQHAAAGISPIGIVAN